MEYTKGQWEATPFEVVAKEKTVADCVLSADRQPGMAKSERSANIHLISAAPDMLEALYQAKEVMEISQVIHAMMPEVGKEPYLKILAAIAKAEGK